MRKHIVNSLMDITIEIDVDADRIRVTGYINPAAIGAAILIVLLIVYLIARK